MLRQEVCGKNIAISSDAFSNPKNAIAYAAMPIMIAKQIPQVIFSLKLIFLMFVITIHLFVSNLYFNINKKDANALISYLGALAEIGINNFNLNGFDDEELCYMDKGVN